MKSIWELSTEFNEEQEAKKIAMRPQLAKRTLTDQVREAIKDISVGEQAYLPEIVGSDEKPIGISLTRMTLRHVSDSLHMNFKTKRHGDELLITRVS